MQRSNDESVQSPGGDRVLKFGAVRVHNGHLQTGVSTTRGCSVCSQGLEGVMEAVAESEKEPEVVKGNGSDSEDDAPLALSSWADSR